MSTNETTGSRNLDFIQIEMLTPKQRERRQDWPIAKVTIHSALGTYSGHEIHDYCGYGRLSVQSARGSILNEDTKQAILERYHQLTPDRYAESRGDYGIWDIAPCLGPAYMIHVVRHTETCKHCKHTRLYGTEEYGTCDSRCQFEGDDPINIYRRVDTAKTLREALTVAARADSPGFYSYGIMPADYAEADQLGIKYFAPDGLLI